MEESLAILRATLEQLSTYELMELSFYVSDMKQQAWTIFVSALFAYLITAHIVGRRLATFEVWVITIVYSSFSILIWSDLMSAYTMSLVIGNQLFGPQNAFAIFFAGGTFIAAWALSLLFMFRARRMNNSDK